MTPISGIRGCCARAASGHAAAAPGYEFPSADVDSHLPALKRVRPVAMCRSVPRLDRQVCDRLQATAEWRLLVLTSFTALQRGGRNRTNSGQIAPSGLTGSAAFDPKETFVGAAHPHSSRPF
jgi:hypothetical protein